MEELSTPLDWDILKKVNEEKINAVEDPEKWWRENEEGIRQYEQFKNSEEYLESPMKDIREKLQKYMEENRYYEVAIPLLRKFSKSYDDYYLQLTEANEKYLRRLRETDPKDILSK